MNCTNTNTLACNTLTCVCLKNMLPIFTRMAKCDHYYYISFSGTFFCSHKG